MVPVVRTYTFNGGMVPVIGVEVSVIVAVMWEAEIIAEIGRSFCLSFGLGFGLCNRCGIRFGICVTSE